MFTTHACSKTYRPRTPRRLLPWMVAATALLSLSTVQAKAQYVLGPFAQITGSDPFAGNTKDNPAGQNGTLYPNSAVEPWVVVNPTNPLNIVATHQQDRWSNGGARGLMEAWSTDGGLTWNPVVVPGIGLTSNGTFQRGSDPWNTFAPNGDLYHVTLAFDDSSPANAVLVSKSTDGGQTWGAPITVALNGSDGFNDKESITADPFDFHYVYTAWDINNVPRFSRTADAGATWSAPSQPSASPNTIDHQIVVSPSGVLYDFYNDYSNGDSAAFVLSTDHGATWSSAFTAQQFQDRNIYDPAGNNSIRDGSGLFPPAVDKNNGNLYITWMDSRFSSGAIDEIAFSGSTDGGMTWSTPIKINQTPTNLPTGSRQALIPSLAVAEDGTICVCYYDFRNTPSNSTMLLTDRFAVFCHPSSSTPFSSASSWGNELRLTDSSFDLHLAPSAGGRMVGDYMATQAIGDDFIDVFGITSSIHPSLIVSRRIGLLAISSLNPNSVPAGSPAFTLTVNGNAFANSAVVNWNGSPLTTTFVSATQLTASVPASLVANPGTASITVSESGQTSAAAILSITNPVPVLSSITPSQIDSGGPAFTLTVKGKGFMNSSIVNWNGSPLTTTFVSATQLTASVPASLIANPGSVKLTVNTPGPGGGLSGFKTLKILVTSFALTVNSLTRDSTTGNYTANITLTNNGYKTAAGTLLNKVLLGAASTSSALPISLGNIVAGASGTATLTFPASAGSPGTYALLKVYTKFTGGTFANSIRVLLPH